MSALHIRDDTVTNNTGDEDFSEDVLKLKSIKSHPELKALMEAGDTDGAWAWLKARDSGQEKEGVEGEEGGRRTMSHHETKRGQIHP